MALPDPGPGRRLITGPKLIEELGLSAKSFMRYRAAGMPKVQRFGADEPLFDPAAVKAWMQEQGLSGKMGPAVSVINHADADTRQAFIQAKLRKEQAQAAKYEHQVALAKAQTISRQAYQSESLAKIAECKARLLALPGKLASRLVGLTAREVQVELEREVRDVLAEFARRDVAPLTDKEAA